MPYISLQLLHSWWHGFPMQVHIDRAGQLFGPYPIEQINALLADGTLLETDLGWTDGMAEWLPLSQVQGVILPGQTPAAPPPPPVGTNSGVVQASGSSKKKLMIGVGATVGVLALAANAPSQAQSVAREIGRDDLLADVRFKDWARNDDYITLVQEALSAAFETATAFEWEDRLSALDVPAAKVRGLSEIMDSEQLAARNMFHIIADRQTGRDYRLPDVGFKFSHDGSAVTDPPPRLGQDTDAVLSDLGYDPAQISALRTSSVVA